MNKAFIKEPEDTGQANCPRCGSLGVPVQQETMAAHVEPGALQNLAETGYFCSFARCDVVYFDHFERVVLMESLLKPVWPKDPEAPICGCFGLTRDDVEQDVLEGGVTRVRELLEKSKSSEANCLVNSPTGKSCMPEVQRYFMRQRAAAQEGPAPS